MKVMEIEPVDGDMVRIPNQVMERVEADESVLACRAEKPGEGFIEFAAILKDEHSVFVLRLMSSLANGFGVKKAVVEAVEFVEEMRTIDLEDH